MKIEVKDLLIKFMPAWICSVIALTLIVGGFFVPPIGVIDGSVILAVGEIIGIIAVLEVPHCLDKMSKILFKHNDTEVNMSSENEDEVPA